MVGVLSRSLIDSGTWREVVYFMQELQGNAVTVLPSTTDAELHYRGSISPIEHADRPECDMQIQNIGWTLGNDCPYHCSHCYSMSARRKGMNLEKWMVDRVIAQLVVLGVKTVNLGGNEPIFTNGLDVRQTLLPYVIESLVDKGIIVGLTTSGITLHKLHQHFASVVCLPRQC